MKYLNLNELPTRLINRLEKIKAPISGLYAIGDERLLDSSPKVAIVGSRKASVYTKELVSVLSSNLSNAGVSVVSGGALGVDIVAHKSSLPHTIGIFGNGLDIIYPAANSKIINEIYSKALALSEYKPSTPPLPHHFLQRNRIVVSLCDALVVAQADIKSGSMSSVGVAIKLGIPIYVLPQRLNESRGTNELLKNMQANLIVDFEAFAMSFVPSKSLNNLSNKNNCDDELLDFCKYGVSLDDAIARFGNKVYEYELLGLLEISNLRVKVCQNI